MDSIDRDLFIQLLRNLVRKQRLGKDIVRDFVGTKYDGSILHITDTEYKLITGEDY